MPAVMAQNTPECGKCGYELMGLPAVGHCPECGHAYDIPSGRGVRGASEKMRAIERGERVVLAAKVGCFGALAVLAMLIAGLRAIGSDTPARPLVIGLIFASVLAFAAGVTWYVEKDREE